MKAKVLNSEKCRILKTKDFSLFNLNNSFSISKRHLNRVRDSISDKNLLRDYPVLVDDNYNILDGKYRFLAAYELNTDIYYKVAEVTTLEDAMKVKHISRGVRQREIADLYKHKEPYALLIDLHREFYQYLSMSEITTLIRYRQDLPPAVFRDSFYSGNLREWDFLSLKDYIEEGISIMKEFGISKIRNTYGGREALENYSEAYLKLLKKYISAYNDNTKHGAIHRMDESLSQAMIALYFPRAKTVTQDTFDILKSVGIKIKSSIVDKDKMKVDGAYHAADYDYFSENMKNPIFHENDIKEFHREIDRIYLHDEKVAHDNFWKFKYKSKEISEREEAWRTDREMYQY